MLAGLLGPPKAVKLKRIAPGYCVGAHNGHQVEVQGTYASDGYGSGMRWHVVIDGKAINDPQPTKREAMLDLDAWVAQQES